jgi:rhamnosyltransferase
VSAPSTGRRIAAVVVTYKPDLSRLREVLEAVALQVQEVLVVDNGSDNRHEIEELVAEVPNGRLEKLPGNLGIGAALNVGVEVHLAAGRDWILTLDQDTVVYAGSVEGLLDELSLLGEELSQSTGVVGMSRGKPPPRGRRRQWIDRSLLVAEYRTFRELRSVITSGNLVRAAVFGSVQYDEGFFIDQVDVRFCADVRRAGWRVLEFREQTMDHQLGHTVELKAGSRIYEGGIRLYYISRNGLSVAMRRDLPVRVFVRDVIGFSRVYVRVNGPRSIVDCCAMVLAGLRDGVLHRFGPRDPSQIRGVLRDLPRRSSR